jgi:hypothetical protein
MMRNYDFNKGVLARGHGKEEKNAAEMQRYGMVDEEKTVAFSFETESSPL